jgi:hypothetical protein
MIKKEKITVRYIRDFTRFKGEHLLSGNLHDNAQKTFTIRRRNGYVIPFLTEEELEDLKALLPGEDISYGNEKFWGDSKFYITLTKNDTTLDTSNPIDYIKYRALQQSPYDQIIAPSWKQRNDLKTYKFAIIKDTEDADSMVQDMSVMQSAWTAWGKYEDDFNTLSYLYHKLRQKTIPKGTKLHVVKAWFKDILEKDAGLFVKYSKEDSLLATKVIVFHATNADILRKEDDLYYFGNVRLSEDPRGGGFQAAAEFLANPKNQLIKFEIESKLKGE